MTRLPPIDPARLSEAQQPIYDAIATGPRKGVRGPLAIWLHRPELAQAAQALGRYCRYDSSVPARLSELTILLMGRHWLAEYEWAAHKPFAIEAGLSVDVIDAIRDDREPPFEATDERLVYHFVRQLHAERQVDQAIYDALKAEIGELAIVDLVGIAGYYTLISMTIKVFDVPAPVGVAPELPVSLT
ncbi:hypothetical protein [Sphingomonas sp. PvP018]|uniref:carboxymuconolactone decarboxylase family protein n=1 Tax=Sphingomonas sp. PvP018 TaxID=2817852 RepID=UPI001AE5CE24|nr:hypothetical protein [Sphingomonas sp. PvP018]MBP2515432.1 4-carboxymuconolactone decarboxylase [Sphingomonas sp. PvP018]